MVPGNLECLAIGYYIKVFGYFSYNNTKNLKTNVNKVS
jgi:hypothetical protein